MGITFAQSGLLFLGSLVSFMYMVEYLKDGSISAGYGGMPFCCLFFGFIGFCLLVGGTVLNILNAVSVSKRTKSKNSLRSLYIFVLYPIVLVSFVIPAWESLFLTSLIFALPFLLIGAVVLPFSAITLHREAMKLCKKEYCTSMCIYCKFPHRRDVVAVDGYCPRCGAFNEYPKKDEEGEETGGSKGRGGKRRPKDRGGERAYNDPTERGSSTGMSMTEWSGGGKLEETDK